MQFRNLYIGQTFDWINDASNVNSFFKRCRKVSNTTYRDDDGVIHSVGTVKAEVFHPGDEEPAKAEPVVAEPGSVSHGTLRTVDLLHAFARVLDDLAQRAHREDHAKLCNEADAMAAKLIAGEAVDPDEESGVLEALFDALNEYSPEGHSFGAHEGDGADYGWWPVEPDDLEATVSDEGWEAEGEFIGSGDAAMVAGWEEREALVGRIKDALGTAEEGEALVEVARNAHRGERANAVFEEYVVRISDDIAEFQRALAAIMPGVDAATVLDRNMTVWEAMSLPRKDRRKIARALAAGTVLFRS